jgi:hypothetical protein
MLPDIEVKFIHVLKVNADWNGKSPLNWNVRGSIDVRVVALNFDQEIRELPLQNAKDLLEAKNFDLAIVQGA